MLTVGRKTELKKIRSNLKRRASTLVLGERGVGKTHLLKHMHKELEGFSYYIESLSSPKANLLDLLSSLADWTEDDLKERGANRWTLKQIAEELLEVIDQREKFFLIIDNLDRVSAAYSQLLENLIEHLPILGAACEIKDSEPLQRFFWAFDTIELKPLKDAEIKRLVAHRVEQVNFKDRLTQRLFTKKVVQAAKGIPLAACEMCQKAANVKTVTRRFIRNLKKHQSSVKYIDASYMWLFLITIAAAMRYISRGMHSTDAYVFFGALYAILLIVRTLMWKRR
jgi:type II secretory pathway predicted ATPase ExeA